MTDIHPRLRGYLEGLCAASVTRYPEYGMFIRDLEPGATVPAEPQEGELATTERLQEFFTCALSDSAAERPEEAQYAVEMFWKIVRECHPHAQVTLSVDVRRGWFDGLNIWLKEGGSTVFLHLDWSGS